MVLNEKGKKVGVSVSYPPANLYHILFELFKNSMRATVETHHKAMSLPKIEVLLAKGEHDVSIRISDQVGSIQYFCSQTAHHDIVREEDHHHHHHHHHHDIVREEGSRDTSRTPRSTIWSPQRLDLPLTIPQKHLWRDMVG